MNIVIVGHVDHGKSTIIGRLLTDTNSVSQEKIESIREKCKSKSKVFEYAYLLDSLRDEQDQGITIETARSFFKTNKRNYLIMDAPGHTEFIKNMVTGASSADAALLVIDAVEGVQENSKRHGYLLALLGISRIIVLINKMDLVDYSQSVFSSIVDEYGDYLSQINMSPIAYVPVSGIIGDNIVTDSANTPWYTGMSVLKTLDSLEEPKVPIDQPFRMSVQDVYKFTANGDSRRIISGTILTGKITSGNKICFLPSGKQSRIKSIESYNRNLDCAEAGYACGFTLSDDIYIQRGELAFLAGDQTPICARAVIAKVFWLGQDDLVAGKKYVLKIGHSRVKAIVSEISKSIDSNSLNEKRNTDKLKKNYIGECLILFDRLISFDLDILDTARFVLVDNYEICGGGIIISKYDENDSDSEQTQFQKMKFDCSNNITVKDRIKRNGHIPRLILVTGKNDTLRSQFSENLENELFKSGYFTYYLSTENLLHSVPPSVQRETCIIYLAGTLYHLLSAGLILVVNADDVLPKEISLIKMLINEYEITSVLVQDNGSVIDGYDIYIEKADSVTQSIRKIFEGVNTSGWCKHCE